MALWMDPQERRNILVREKGTTWTATLHTGIFHRPLEDFVTWDMEIITGQITLAPLPVVSCVTRAAARWGDLVFSLPFKGGTPCWAALCTLKRIWSTAGYADVWPSHRYLEGGIAARWRTALM